MSNENKIENLEEFLKDVSNILLKAESDEKNLAVENLNNYLISILNNKDEFQKFLKSIDSLIFLKKPNELSQSISKQIEFNSKPFIIYKIIYSINPKLTIDYIDYFLSSLKLFICEENESDFPFLCSIFCEIINSFYNKDKNNSLNNKIDNEQKEQLYQKLFSFIFNNLKIHKKKEQTFLCLLLIEFIENCPQVKEEKNIGSLFKEISGYLENKKIECKIELLNCIISLILTTEQKFKSYANVCLFRILDYLTDDDWIKRKLAINIVYTLVFYCKDEIMAVKENIIEFLNILKEDNVSEIREICLQTLQFFEKKNSKNNEKIKNEENIIKKIRNHSNLNKNKSKEFTFNPDNNDIEQNKNEIKNNYDNSKNKKENNSNIQNNGFMLYKKLIKNKQKTTNIIKNNKNSLKNTKKSSKNRSKRGSSSIKSFDTSSNTHYKQKQDIFNIINSEERNTIDKNNNISLLINNILGNENSESYELKSDQRSIINNSAKNYKIKTLNKKNLKKQDTNQEIRRKFRKEKKLLEDIERRINERNPKQYQLNSYANQNTKKNILKFNNHKEKKNIRNKNNVYINKIQKDSPKNEKIIINVNKNLENERITKYKESIDIPIINTNEENTDKNNKYIDFKEEENNYSQNYNKLEKQLNAIQKTQNNIIEMIKDLKNTMDLNYLRLDKRITNLESYHMNSKSQDKYWKEIDEDIELEIIENKFKNGKYNEALIEAEENDKYLYKILSLISQDIINQLDLSLIGDLISHLCLKLSKLITEERQNNISYILSFFNQIIKSKINLKLNIQKNLKDTIKLIKNENNLFLSQKDKNIIDIILKYLNE